VIGSQNSNVIEDMISYSRHKNHGNSRGLDNADSSGLSDAYETSKQKQKSFEHQKTKTTQLGESIDKTNSYSFMKSEDKYHDFLQHMAKSNDQSKGGYGVKYGLKNAQMHIEDQDKYFQNAANQYIQLNTPIQRMTPNFGQDVDKIKTSSANFGNETKEVIDQTNIEKVKNKPPSNNDYSSAGLKKAVTESLNKNEPIIQDQEVDTKKDAKKLERKIDAADDTIFAGKVARKYLGIGTENPFTKNRKGDDDKK